MRWGAAALALLLVALGVFFGLRRPAQPRSAPLEVAAPRGAPSEVALVRVRTREETGAARFEGHVVSASTNAGIARAELTFAFGATVETVTTDQSGVFVFSPVSPGSHVLVGIVADGFSPYVPEQDGVRLEARAGVVVTGLYFELDQRAPLEVTVLAGGAAVADAVVSLRTPGTLGLTAPAQERTDAGGKVVLSGCAGDVVETEVAGYAHVTHVVAAAEARAGKLVLSLVAGTSIPSTVTGRVVDDRGAPIDGAQVTAVRQGGGPMSEAVTSSDGRFELVVAGTARVSASRAPYVPAEVVTQPGADVTLVLHRGCSLRGTVLDRDRHAPIASFTVVLQRVTGVGLVPSSPTVYDAEGRFEVRGAMPGRYAVQVLAAGYAVSASRIIEVLESCSTAEETFSLGHGGTVFGRLTDGASHHPLVGRVSMEGFVDAGSSPIKVSSSATSDAEGNFELGGLPAGRRSLVAEVEGFHSRMAAGIDIGDGARSGSVDLELDAVPVGGAARMQVAGVGAVLRPGDGSADVVSLVPGGGAEQAGLQPGDRIVSIDEKQVRDMSFDDAMQAIRGAENTTVTLGIVQKRNGATASLRVLRSVLR